MIVLLATLTFAAWVFLYAVHSGFWWSDQRLPAIKADAAYWPSVTAIVPARNEAPTIRACVESLLAQDYPGAFRVIVVDDNSDDGTGDLARAAIPEDDGVRLRVINAPPLEPGWTGKLWALQTGVHEAEQGAGADYLWFTDADIVHAPATLGRLMGMADERSRDMVSLMVKLHAESFWEKLVIPAFIYFFQMLYPFRAVNDDRSPMAAAAGGCVLLRRAALEKAGGLAAIKGALIDDCALARAIKSSGGHIWLGLADDSHSLRSATTLAPLWAMVRRTAFTQLHHSYLLTAGTLVGLALVFLAPALLFLTTPWHAQVAPGLAAGVAWLLMVISFAPTARDYGLAPWFGLALPVSAALYGAMTADSALAYRRGQGGTWKGRHYDPLATPPDMPKSP